MPTYRAYRLDNRRHIRHGAWLTAKDDRSAIKEAGELCDEATPHVEIWQASRLVDQIECGED